jgi:hypothetical protein
MADEAGPSKRQKTEENDGEGSVTRRRTLLEVLGRPDTGHSRFSPRPLPRQEDEEQGDEARNEPQRSTEDDVGMDMETRKKLRMEYNAIATVNIHENAFICQNLR